MGDDKSIDRLEPTSADGHLAAGRAVLAGLGLVPVVGSFAGAALEMLPSPAERQHERALRTLFRVVEELKELVTAADWRRAIGTEEFDAAWVRSISAAQRAQSEAKREFIWFALMNGYVRTEGDPERDRFLRLIERYDVDHVQALVRLKALVPGPKTWLRVESQMLSTIGGERDAAYAYVQEFDADGLVRLYDQPVVGDDVTSRSGSRWGSSTASAYWTERANRFLEFVTDPREMTPREESRAAKD